MKMNLPIVPNFIHSASSDFFFILLPPFLVALVLAGVHAGGWMPDSVDAWAWALLVLAVDVSHVYSTLYRTYWDAARRKHQAILLLLTPIFCYTAGVFLYALSAGAFWRIMAYLAVFHFIRQQYGFMRLYSRGQIQPKYFRALDACTVYVLTLHPMVYWHTHSMSIQWFTAHDFFTLPSWMYALSQALYLACLVLYFCKEAYLIYHSRQFNLNKNLVILGTGVSWYAGIILFEEDFAFTALNVLSHGIPYMALVWMTARKETAVSGIKKILFSKGSVLWFILSLLLLAYVEEGWWDALVWQEHATLFPLSRYLQDFDFSGIWWWLIPLLSLPQTTHYVLDGFIWRRTSQEKKNTSVS